VSLPLSAVPFMRHDDVLHHASSPSLVVKQPRRLILGGVTRLSSDVRIVANRVLGFSSFD
jgi:hypothetical protein